MNASVQDMRERLKTWPLIVQPSNRSESPLTDARLVNCFAEMDPNQQRYKIQKRIGFTLQYNVGSPNVGGGCYNFGQINGPRSLYSVFSSGLVGGFFKDGVITGASIDRISVGQKYLFAELQTPTNSFLIFASPQTLYFTTGTGWTAPVVPAHGTFIRGLAVLDETVYFMDEVCNIYGSNIADPTTWSALNVVPANTIAGEGKGLAQLLQYIFALKSNSREAFQDNANPTGSPLSPVAGAVSNYGCVDGRSIQVIDNVLFYLSSNKTVSPQLVRVDGLVETVISTPAIEKLVDSAQQTIASGNIFSWSFKHGGHRFYGLTVQSLNITLVYDIDQNLWYQWTGTNTGIGTIFGLLDMSYSGAFLHAAQGVNDGNIYTFEGDYQYPTDNGTVVPVDIYTPNEDFGTRRRKTMHRMYIESDQTPGSLLYVRRSDDDYKSWSNFRKIDLSRKSPFIDSEGTYIRRAYHFRHASRTAFRIWGTQLQQELGTI